MSEKEKIIEHLNQNIKQLEQVSYDQFAEHELNVTKRLIKEIEELFK